MTPFLMLAAALAAGPAGDWRFHDATTRDGRSVVSYRTVTLGDTSSTPLPAAETRPAGAKFGATGIGVGGELRVNFVWHAESRVLWCDADGDGRFPAGERHTLGDTPLEIAVQLPTGETTTAPRTLLVRRRGDGVAAAVRGYTAGTVDVAGKPVAALLTDGDGDGVFGSAGVDRVWLDLDGDGTFDPLTERFASGEPIAAGGAPLLVAARPDGLGATTRARPAATGTLRVEIDPKPGSEIVELRANYLSEFGELVTVQEANTAVEIPAGQYRIDSLSLKLVDADGKLWHYAFWSPKDGFPVTIEGKGRANHAPLAGLKLSAILGKVGSTAAGRTVQVFPVVRNSTLTMRQCDAGARHGDYAPGVPAELLLNAPGSTTLDRRESLFLCGGLCNQTLQAPREVPADGLEIRVTYPTGPSPANSPRRGRCPRRRSDAEVAVPIAPAAEGEVGVWRAAARCVGGAVGVNLGQLFRTPARRGRQ